jgi:hypothetical protein
MAEMTPGQPDEAGELLFTRQKTQILIPQVLLDDYADMGDLLGKALRGEIEFKPPPEPPWHRCALCWLISLLPGHDRCEHGRLSCDDCYSDY